MEPEVRELFKRPDILFGREPEPGQKMLRGVFLVKPQDYSALVVEKMQKGIVSLQKTKPDITNGEFGVPKNEVSDPMNRGIVDATPTNVRTLPLSLIHI